MKIIFFGIIFLIVGLIFCGVAFYLGRSESVKKTPIAKPCSFIFYIIGALTFAIGLLFLVLSSEFTKKAFQLTVIIYLACITILLFIFTRLIKGGQK